MEFRLHAAMNAEKEIADAENYSFLRSFNVKQEMSHRPLSDLQGEWRVCDSGSAGDFSAVGYFFARELYRKLGVPIGFINTSWGGTDIESWIVWAIDKFPKYKRLQDRMRSSQFEEYVRRSDENRAKFVESMKAEPGISEKWYLPSYSKDDWKEVSVPGLWSKKDWSLSMEWCGKPVVLHCRRII